MSLDRWVRRPLFVGEDGRAPPVRSGDLRELNFAEGRLCNTQKAVSPVRPLFRRYAWGGAGVRPWRRMISAIFARSGGPPGVPLITSAVPRKYCGPIAAGVITQSVFTSWIPLLSNR
jgi:hypothetical protein